MYVYVQKTEVTENENFRLFAANGNVFIFCHFKRKIEKRSKGDFSESVYRLFILETEVFRLSVR
jgi:hypothetical protein